MTYRASDSANWRWYLLVIALLWIARTAGAADDPLASGFRDPSPSARPMTWWHWMGGNISREGITADLESMKRAGLQGAMIFHVGQLPFNGDVQFMSQQWWDMMRFAADEAARLDLKLGMHNCPGWSASGGPWIPVEQSMQKLVWSTTTVDGNGHHELKLPKPQVDARWNHFRDIAVIALPDVAGPVDQDKVLDLTGHMHDGTLAWDAPPGRWRVYRFGHTTTGKENHPAPPGGNGLEVDKFNPDAVQAHFNAYPAKVLANNTPAGRKAFTMLTIDSYEAGDQNWSPVFRGEFQRRRGYDPVKWLPILAGQVIGNDDLVRRFKHDMQRTIADLYHDNYYGQMGKLVHQYPGVQYCVEPYGGEFDTIAAGGKADLVMGEFWIESWAQVSTVASSAHVHGKALIGAEAFTADPFKGQWRADPYALKPTGDAALAAGVNLMVLHTFTHQPWTTVAPGFTMGWWGTHFGRTQTWWNQSRPFFDYLARCQYMLQQGVHVADTLSLVSDIAPTGYKADACDEDLILHELKVRDGQLVLPDGTRYAVLVLPPDAEQVSQRLAARVRELVRDGATIIGPKPISTGSLSDYPDADADVKRVGEDVWGDCDGTSVKTHQYGRGRVFRGADLPEVLAQLKVTPDVSFPDGTWPLAWTHRRTADADIYFLANRRRVAVSAQVSLRTSGGTPELWDPETGEIRPAPVWSTTDGRTQLFLRLAPAGSTFVVFRRSTPPADHVVEMRLEGKPLTRPDQPYQGVVIHQAVYGVLDDPQRCIDVTAAIQQRLNSVGTLSGNNDLAGRDPAPMVIKSIRIVYDVRGQRMTRTFREGEPIDFEAAPPPVVPLPPAELICAPAGPLSLLAYKRGTYTLRFASGRTEHVKIDRVPDEVMVTGPWHVEFPPGLGAPSAIDLPQLVSWTTHAHAGVRYFSGTAQYTTTFTAPSDTASSVTLLDLGDVRNIAEVELNGQSLGLLWKPPFRADVSGKLRAGVNELKVRVTNLWPNRMIGDEQEPDDAQWADVQSFPLNDKPTPAGQPLAQVPAWVHDPTTRPSKGRVTLTTWKFYSKDSPLLESGLLGPVRIVSAAKKDLQ
jgi:hypothetical protein